MELCMTQLWREHRYEWSLYRDPTAHNTEQPPHKMLTVSVQKPQRYISHHPLTVTAPSIACCTTVSLLQPPLKSTLNIKGVIKYRDETAALMLCLSAVCLMMKVTLSSVADFQNQQDHPDWWPGSGCRWWFMRRGGSVAWLPGGMLSCWWQCLVYGLYVCEEACAACANETAPPVGLKPEKKAIDALPRIMKTQHAGVRDQRGIREH